MKYIKLFILVLISGVFLFGCASIFTDKSVSIESSGLLPDKKVLKRWNKKEKERKLPFLRDDILKRFNSVEYGMVLPEVVKVLGYKNNKRVEVLYKDDALIRWTGRQVEPPYYIDKTLIDPSQVGNLTAVIFRESITLEEKWKLPFILSFFSNEKKDIDVLDLRLTVVFLNGRVIGIKPYENFTSPKKIKEESYGNKTIKEIIMPGLKFGF